MFADLLIPLLILSPMVAAGLVFAIRSGPIRNALIAIEGGVLIVSGALLASNGMQAYVAGRFAGLNWNGVVAVADALLLLAFLALAVIRRSWLAGLLAAAQVAGFAYLETQAHGRLSVSQAFYVDWLSITMVLIVSIIGSVIAIYAIPYMKEHENHTKPAKSLQPRFFALILLFLGAMNGLVLANNLYWLYLFWEITTFCCVLLIGHDGTEEAVANSTRALWMNLVGGLAFIAALVLLTRLDGGREPLSVQQLVAGPTPYLLPVALLCVAGFTKSAQLPFQGWLLGAMVAPTPVSALLHSSTMVKAGVYLVVRCAPAFQESGLTDVVALLGGFTFVLTAMMAISQRNAKRVLAYSTISNLGLIIGCAGINTSMAIASAIMLIIFHAVSKALLFMAAGVMEQRIGSREIEKMEGLYGRMPFTTSLTVLGILTMLLPPFGVLISKWAALESAAREPLAMVMFVLGSAFTVVFWVKWIGRMVQTDPRGPVIERHKIQPVLASTMGFLAVAAVALSVLVIQVMQMFVAPVVASYPDQAVAGYHATVADLGSKVGSFPVLGLTITLVAAIVVPLVVMMLRPKPQSMPYMCGEPAEEGAELGFRSAGDAIQPVKIRGYYLERFFSDEKHTPWANVVAVCLLIALVGVASL